MQERFIIENVFFNTTGTNRRLLVFVRNVGVEETKIVALYVNGTALPPTGSGGTCGLGMPVTIPVGSVCEFNLNVSSFNPVTGSIFYITVASLRGNSATFTVRMYVAGT